MVKIKLFFLPTLFFIFTSCHTYIFDVGRGVQTGLPVEESLTYLFFGLVELNTPSLEELSRGASDYSVKIEHTLNDKIMAIITLGIYTPMTIIVVR